jgi:hypothetical protein
MLTSTIEFGANAQGAPVLAAMTALGEQLATDTRWTTRNPRIHPRVVTGPWKHLVFGHPARPGGAVDRGAYIFCVLEQFCRHLNHREIYADASTRHRNPQARLLDGAEWEAVKDDVLTTLGLPENPDALLASHVTGLDEALTYVAGRLAANTDVRVDEAGSIHVTSDKAVQDPPSLTDLRKRVAAMLPRVDIGEQILEVVGWVPQFLKSLSALSGGAARMTDLNVTVAAALTGQALNIGYGRVHTGGARAGTPPDRPRGPYLPAGRRLYRRQPAPDRPADRDRLRPGAGRRAGRRDRRDAVRRPRPVPDGQAQPEILRAQTRDDMAQRDQRPGVRDRV